MKTSEFGGIIYVENATVQELEDFLKYTNIRGFALWTAMRIPPFRPNAAAGFSAD